MKAISLWQPWASLVVWGCKQYETRGWHSPTWLKTGTTVAIHAAKKWNHELADTCLGNYFKDRMETHGVDPYAPVLPLGAIVGIAVFMGCFHSTARSAVTEEEREFGDWSPGRFAWMFVRPQCFKTPIPFRGMQGFFDVPDALPMTQGRADAQRP